ncbi:flagellin N-terminal helical domain-containing protein [Rhizobium sp. CF142]|uniref:flagellin N-terminal helical domain-containing protein n=1 Tax=Rhizobium sp. CF142 TaxID=1144314 RepID=UPI00026EFC04|nr:flagellin [Rhizobium sp. CF142]EJJ25671.1 flagellin/flagellar hook associated protein [Rhizobium sp. CF142]
MTSILTNNAAMAALQTLRGVNDSLKDTQGRVSSGYRIDKAADNAAYWSIATTMRSDNKALGAVSDALGLGAAKVDTAYTAMDNAIDVVTEIKAKIVAATEKGVDKTKIQEELDQLQEQLVSIAQSASFSGENWVAGASGTKSVVSSFVRDGSNAVSVKMTDYVLDAGTLGNVLFGMNSNGTIQTTSGIIGTAFNGTYGNTVIVMPSIYALDITNFTQGQLDGALSGVELVLQAMTNAGSQLGSISTRIQLQETFVSALTDSIDSGVGRLVDADMEEESSKLSALQTQQQLAIQSLSIANSSAQNILSLFRS